MSNPPLPPLGLYIHLPWCERKCPYCDFNSHEAAELPQAAYVATLLADLERDLDFVQGRAVDTLFIGGGTPSLFSAGAIETLLQGIASRVALAPDLEATMEANPGSAEADKFAGFRAAGINRLSLGVQSFDDERLRALGRVHDSNQAHAAVEMARTAGFDSFNLDLMHGLPGQSAAGAGADLAAAMAHSPPHLSWYQLTLEPNTVFYKRPPQLPLEEDLADIQDAGELALRDQGYGQYEVSAYSRAGHQCRHNLNYWSFGDYLGIGAGAHGKVTLGDGRIARYSKRRQPGQYLDAGEWRTGWRELSRRELPGDFMLNALRLNEGFAEELFSARTGLGMEVIAAQLAALQEQGLLEVGGGFIRTTPLGRRFLDDVVGEFL